MGVTFLAEMAARNSAGTESAVGCRCVAMGGGRLVCAVLLVVGLTAAVSQGASCSDQLSCKACGEEATCKWCAGDLSVNGAGQTMEAYALGKCVPTGNVCANEQIGDLSSLLNFDVSVMGIAVTSTWALEELPKSDPSCTSVEWPPVMMDSATCSDCAAAKGTWCHAELQFKGLSPQTVTGGVCLPGALAFICDNTLIPQLSTLEMLFAAKAKRISDATKCDSLTPDAVPSPSATCKDNLSCKNCGNSASDCTWCGLGANINYGGMEIDVNTAGTCLDGAAASCDNVHFGSVENLNHLPGFPHVFVKALPVSDALCSEVQWPQFATFPSCQPCTTGGTAGWCEMTIAQSPSETLGAGLCLDQTLGFACQTGFVPSALAPGVTTKWTTDSGTCPETTPAPEPVCADMTNCSRCGRFAGCNWCGGFAGLSDPEDTLLGEVYSGLGYCTDQTACPSKLGSLDSITQFSGKELGKFGKMTYELRTLTSSDAEICDGTEVDPKIHSLLTCADCVGGGGNWCVTAVDVAGIGKKTGGYCAGAEECPASGSRKSIDGPGFMFDADWVTEKAVKDAKNCQTNPPVGVDDCTKNLDCASCSAATNCGWCAALAKVTTSGVKNGMLPLNIGECIDKLTIAKDCPKLEVPPVAELFEDASQPNMTLAVKSTSLEPDTVVWCQIQNQDVMNILSETCEACIEEDAFWKLDLGEGSATMCAAGRNTFAPLKIDWSPRILKSELKASAVTKCSGAAVLPTASGLCVIAALLFFF